MRSPVIDMRDSEAQQTISARKVARDAEWLRGQIGAATYLRSLMVLGYDLPSARHEFSILNGVTIMSFRSEEKPLILDALRSGKYQQCQFYIANNHSYCCIGVAALSIGLENIGILGNGTGECTRALGLSAEEAYKLVAMNDGEGKNFFEIADYIEQNL